MILSNKNKFEFEVRNIGGSDVYYKRKVGDVIWLFSTKENFEQNNNIMSKQYTQSDIDRGAEIEMEHKITIEKFMKDGTNVKEVAKAIAIDHLEENPLSYSVSDEDVVTMNIPLLIRMLELAREDIKSDADLHKVVEKIIIASKKKDVLRMEDYDSFLVNIPKEESFSTGGKIIDDNGSLSYTINDDEITLDLLRSKDKRKGTATKLIKKLKDLSREKKLPIGLYAEPLDESISDEDLINFYYKNGFDLDPNDTDGKLFIWNYKNGGNISKKENSIKIECKNPKCDWIWDIEKAGDDKFVCHKCYTDNEKFYKKGGSLENNFEIEEDEDRITISLKGIGEVILVQTFPEYEFIEDINEDELEELNVSEGDIIGKIEHLEVNDKFKGKGYAKLLMNKAIELAEENGWMPLYLNASPMGSKRYGLGIEDLTGFYESFGFKVFLNQGGNNLMLLNEIENQNIGSNTDVRFDGGGDVKYKLIVPNTNSAYDKQAQLFILDYLKRKKTKKTAKKHIKDNVYEVYVIYNKLYPNESEIEIVNSIEKAYNGSLDLDVPALNIVKVKLDSKNKTSLYDYYNGDLFGNYDGEKYDEKGNLKEEVKQKAINNIKKHFDRDWFKDGGKIQLNSNKGKVNLKLSSYEDVTELVPVSELLKFREFDRNERPKYSLEDSKENISKLEKELIEKGIEEPLIIEYSLEDNSVLLIEGNHRLNVAVNLGFDYLPARVVLRRREFAPLQKTKAFKVKGFTPDRYNYVPSDLKPSQVGIGGTTKAFEDGGIVEGQLHSECNEETGCGEKYDVGGVGHIIEVERDEAVIVSKAFQDNNEYEVKGTLSEIASALNVLGDGKNFDSGAEIKSEDGKKVEVAEIKKEAKNTDVETIDPNSIIINRRSMYDKEEYIAKGTPKQIASQINNINDNGVKIVDGGSIKKT